MHWIVVIIAFSFIIIIHELGHFLAAIKVGVRVERFSIGFGPALLKIKKGDTEFVIAAVPLGGFVKLAGEDVTSKPTGGENEFMSKSIPARFFICASGALFNLISAFIVISFLFMSGETAISSDKNVIGAVIKNYPAEKAGLLKGDTVVALDEKSVTDWREITSIIHNKKDTPLTVGIRRGDKLFDIVVVPKTEEHKDIFGRNIKMSFIGIAPEVITKRYGLAAAVYMGFKTTWFLTGKIYQGIWLIITRQVSVKNVAGPIGIIALSGQAAKTGMSALLGLMALISVNLAVVNLLPFPILDGGHILFLALEKIRGKPLGQKTQEIISQVALYILIAVFLLISYNDLMRTGIIGKISKLRK